MKRAIKIQVDEVIGIENNMKGKMIKIIIKKNIREVRNKYLLWIDDRSNRSNYKVQVYSLILIFGLNVTG